VDFVQLLGKLEVHQTNPSVTVRNHYNICIELNFSSAGDDGRIRLWKAASGNVWRPAGSVGVEQARLNSTASTNLYVFYIVISLS